MIKLEKTEVLGWEHAIRGMRNPMNSWERSDSYETDCDHFHCGDAGISGNCKECLGDRFSIFPVIGPNDHDLMMRLVNGGPVHAKYRRMITVYVTITAPLYWWKEFDTYKVGTVANSCSTMHKIAAKEFDISDFSIEHLETIARFDEDGEPHQPYMVMKSVIDCLNACREAYLKTKNKTDWWQMIQLLPSSYNQKRTVMLNYEVLAGIYQSRKNHKLDEWREFCKWIESLPYSEIIIGKPEEKKDLKDIPIANEIMEEAKRRVLEEMKTNIYTTTTMQPITPEMIKQAMESEFFQKFAGTPAAMGLSFNDQRELCGLPRIENLIDVSRPGDGEPRYILGVGMSESDLTPYERELLEKSNAYWDKKKE